MNVSTDNMDGTDEYLVFDFPIHNTSADNSKYLVVLVLQRYIILSLHYYYCLERISMHTSKLSVICFFLTQQL